MRHLSYSTRVPSQCSDAVKVTAVQRNKPAELIFLVPELTAGTYRLRVTTRARRSEDLRIGLLNPLLTVS